MGALSTPPAQCDADFLRRVLEQAHGAATATLDELAGAPPPPLPNFPYIDRRDGSLHTIPGAQFRRQYALCLDALELTIYGYCVSHPFGWERRLEAAFCTRRPGRWRRLLEPATLMALHVEVSRNGTQVSVGMAPRGARSSKSQLIVRLGDLHQSQTAPAVEATPPRRSVAAWLRGWLRRWRAITL